MKNLRFRYLLLLLFIFPIGAMGIGLAFGYSGFGTTNFENMIIAVVFMSWPIIIVSILKKIRCPRCKRTLFTLDQRMESKLFI